MSRAEPAPEGESAVYKKLHADLIKRGVCSFRFHRVPGPYYDKPIELRAQRLNAPSVDHLCKTMVMENTRAPEELLSIDDPRASKYFMVLVQYTSSIDAGKLGQFVHKVCVPVSVLVPPLKSFATPYLLCCVRSSTADLTLILQHLVLRLGVAHLLFVHNQDAPDSAGVSSLTISHPECI